MRLVTSSLSRRTLSEQPLQHLQLAPIPGAHLRDPLPVLPLLKLRGRLEQELVANPKLRVMIRSDGKVKYSVNEEVMNACAEVGASDLIYSAFEK